MHDELDSARRAAYRTRQLFNADDLMSVVPPERGRPRIGGYRERTSGCNLQRVRSGASPGSPQVAGTSDTGNRPEPVGALRGDRTPRRDLPAAARCSGLFSFSSPRAPTRGCVKQHLRACETARRPGAVSQPRSYFRPCPSSLSSASSPPRGRRRTRTRSPCRRSARSSRWTCARR